MKKFMLTVSNGIHNADREIVVEVDEEEWAGMSEQEREEYMHEELFNIIEWNWYEITENDEETE